MNLANTLLFRGMEPSDIDEMLGCLLAKERTYKKGEIIFPEGSPTEQIGVVLTGRVVIELGDVWGNNSVLSSIGPGGVFAEAYACVPGEPLMVNVTAAEDTEALLLNIKRVLEPCSKVCPYHVRLVQNLLALCAGKNLQLSRRVLHTGPKSIRKRLLSFFSECIKRTGSYSFDIPYNRQQLADYLSVERSALSNELSIMQRDGLIRYEKNHFDVMEQIED
ncbi:Crp/Fnr family transcriptional regulator [Clostridiales bacterium NSJ-40]|uniref:Crp/Fnr family transcriptional regulator n=1 Tax=Yeguia hominis TaxID=2763662 RepID=A0A926DD84_9FIRM|nr:Crp/Fnr family transcriptional regulator [Yeguia hominis]